MPRFLQPLAQWVRVVGAVSDHPFRLLPGPAFGPGDADLCERGFRERSFTRRGTFQPNSQWKTLAVDQYHPLRSLAALGFYRPQRPFFRRSEAAVQKALFPPQQALAVEGTQQRSPRIEPDVLRFPLLPDDASRWPGTVYLSGRNPPRCSCLQHPENPLQTRPV